MKPVSILALQKVAVAQNGGHADIDVSQYTRQAKFILTAKSDAGTSPTLDVVLQTSPGLARGYQQLVAGTTDNKLLSSSTTANALASTFVADGDVSIKRVGLMLKKNGTIASGKKLTLSIKTDDSGNPDASLGTAVVDIDTEVSTEYSSVLFTFDKPIDLTDEDTYHLELTTDYTASGDNNVTWRSNTVAEGGNFVQLDDSTWTADPTEDLEVFVEQYVFQDIHEFTQVESAASIQEYEVPINNIGSVVRAVTEVGGMSNPAFYLGLTALVNPAVSL